MLVSETLVVVFSCRECVNSLFEELINIEISCYSNLKTDVYCC